MLNYRYYWLNWISETLLKILNLLSFPHFFRCDSNAGYSIIVPCACHFKVFTHTHTSVSCKWLPPTLFVWLPFYFFHLLCARQSFSFFFIFRLYFSHNFFFILRHWKAANRVDIHMSNCMWNGECVCEGGRVCVCVCECVVSLYVPAPNTSTHARTLIVCLPRYVCLWQSSTSPSLFSSCPLSRSPFV